METCPKCDAEIPGTAATCSSCGADTGAADVDATEQLKNADYDPEEERKVFERRYGIDIGDRTVDEFLSHLDQQDYSLTIWFWLLVVAELVGVAVFAVNLWGPHVPRVAFVLAYPAVSLVLSIAIVGDTRIVGQFRTWSRTRLVYVLLAAVPLVGHVTGALYSVLRRLKHEQTEKHRRRLLDAGFDLGSESGGT